MLYLKLLPIIFFPVLFWIIPHPEGVAAPTWHMVGIYLAMLCGLVLRPFTDAVIMLIMYVVERKVRLPGNMGGK